MDRDDTPLLEGATLLHSNSCRDACFSETSFSTLLIFAQRGRSFLSVDDESHSETESSLSDLAFDKFSSALVGGATATTASPDTQQTDAKAQDSSVSVTLPDVGGQFDSQDDGASASAQWHGRSVVVTMVFLMMLSSAQLIVGIIYSFLFVGIPPLVTAVLGLLVSSGHMLGYIPGGHLEKQVKVVRHFISRPVDHPTCLMDLLSLQMPMSSKLRTQDGSQAWALCIHQHQRCLHAVSTEPVHV